mmetsp:Transcript_4412/g.10674  ORF Transcript_4412/g.10674 Transcript_4412/m.10674 type:complete len:1332 (-) Transcript_4412:111-4106(-)
MSNTFKRNESQSSMNSSNSSFRRGNSRRGGNNSRQPSNLTSLPYEQGIICCLKESFGFIHCAERPDEIFFHYSEVINCHPDDLQIDTEVEFKVGASSGGGNSSSSGSISDDSKKLAAFSIKTLEKGTVVWETEEKEGHVYRGVVEKQCPIPRGGNNNGPQTDGTIRIIPSEDEEATSSNDDNDSPPGVVEGADDDSGDNNNSNSNSNIGSDETETKKKKKKQRKKKTGPVVRLRAGEYTGAKIANGNETGKRESGGNASNRLYKGDLITFRVFLDRRTKQKYARQITLLQSERERKKIEKEKRLLENATEEEGVVISLNNGFGFIRSNRRREDVYFHYSHLVIPDVAGDEEDDEFELVKGQEVRFLVVTEEQAERQNSNKFSNSNNSGGNSNVRISARQIHCLPKGSVVFHTVVAKGVKGVVLRAPLPPSPGSKGDDSKMGFVGLRSSLPENGVVIQGDISLHFSDVPGGVFTYLNHRNVSASGVWIQDGDTLLFDVIKEVADGSYRAVPTLHKLGLGGSVIPPNTANEENSEEQPVIRLVSLSLAGRAEGVIHTLKADYGFIHFAERPVDVHFKTYDFIPEELQRDIRKCMGFDQKVALAAEAAVQFDICAHGNITTTTQRGRRRGAQHARENIRGQRIVLLPKSTVALEKVLATDCKGVIKSINPQQLYTGSIDLDDNNIKPMSMDERHPIVAEMITSFLEESSLPNGRKTLVFRDTLGMNDDDVVTEMANLKGGTALECTHIPVPGIAPHPGRICIRRIESEDDNKAEQAEAESEKDLPKSAASTKGKKKVKQQNIRPLKNIRFEKGCLDEEFKKDVPPSPGDIIVCDIVQNRRNGKIIVKNLKITERKFGEGNPAVLTETESSGLGVVKDVVLRRNFGFIAVFDENNTRNEILFFHLPKDKRFVKGNEVKFDIAMEGTKRVAINVESVRNGTIPSVASKNACLGYILMEPSHTTLKNTPARKTAKGSGDKVGNGRWADSNDDAKATTLKQDMVEDGCILLLEDKTGMFQKQRVRRRKNRSASVDSVASCGDVSVDETKSVGSVDGLRCEDDDLSSDDGGREENGIVSILSRISYTNGSIAIHGAGATSSMDGSTHPKRGDLVSFGKGRKRKTARDIRIVKREKATLQRGRLEDIQIIETEDKKNKGTAQFIAATANQEVYDIDLADVISCSASILKEKESMEGILHDGKIYGLCRTSDLYLASKIVVGSGKNRQRPKLNLTVKKDRGGTIMAQSMMAKGPDGSAGFKAGWTKRVSRYTLPKKYEIIEDVKQDEVDLDDSVQPTVNVDKEENAYDQTQGEEDENVGNAMKNETIEDGTKGNVGTDADV